MTNEQYFCFEKNVVLNLKLTRPLTHNSPYTVKKLVIYSYLVSPQYHCQYDDLYESTTGTQARSIPTSQWQYKAGLSAEKPELTEEEQAYEDLWDEQSYEDYYSSNEGGEAVSDSEEEAVVDEGENEPDIYITRSGRKSKPWIPHPARPGGNLSARQTLQSASYREDDKPSG